MNHFYSPSIAEGTFLLPEEEAHHAASVLRSKAGDRIGILDGKGTSAVAEIVSIDRKKCEVKVITKETFPPERSAHIHIAVGLTKQIDRFEWFVEKAVEIGVDRITPLFTQRTERSKLRTDRLQRVMIAAMKQSQRKWLPQLDEAMSLKELFGTDLPLQRYFGWCEGDHRSLKELYDRNSDALVVIGPEGDLSPEEAELLIGKQFAAISIGAARLRTETAAIAACTWMSLAQQR